MLSLVDLEAAAEYLRILASVVETESFTPRVDLRLCPEPYELRDLADDLDREAAERRRTRYGHRPRRA